jgi:hypothetical protein
MSSPYAPCSRGLNENNIVSIFIVKRNRIGLVAVVFSSFFALEIGSSVAIQI